MSGKPELCEDTDEADFEMAARELIGITLLVAGAAVYAALKMASPDREIKVELGKPVNILEVPDPLASGPMAPKN